MSEQQQGRQRPASLDLGNERHNARCRSAGDANRQRKLDQLNALTLRREELIRERDELRRNRQYAAALGS